MKIRSRLRYLSNSLTGVLLFLSVLIPPSCCAYAHQPRISLGARHTLSDPIVIKKPEISKVYYGILSGEPDFYRIDSRTPYQLYLNILVPDRRDSSIDINVDVVSDNKTLLRLRGKGYKWERFFEPMARDHYLKGPELDWRLRQGTYYIKVYNKGNSGRYSLAVGSIESFSFFEAVRTAFTLPAVKSKFFNKPAYSAFISPVGLILLGYLIIAAGGVFGAFFIIRRYMIR
ncbi:MAG: hypothetical protein WC547_09290 [Candidatus Omnitrophota bacterium]